MIGRVPWCRKHLLTAASHARSPLHQLQALPFQLASLPPRLTAVSSPSSSSLSLSLSLSLSSSTTSHLSPRAFSSASKHQQAQYDGQARAYERAKANPVRRYEYGTFLHNALPLMAEVAGGARVLDLACGGGFYTTMLLEGGASEIVGVDISNDQIELAQERFASQSVSFHQANVEDYRDPRGGRSFDLVLGNWLFCYADSRRQAHNFAATVAYHLKDGGTFLGINTPMLPTLSAWLEEANPEVKEKIGVHFEPKRVDGTPLVLGKDSLEEGDRISITLYDHETGEYLLNFDNRWLPQEAYQEAFEKQGLKLEWLPPVLDPATVPEQERAYLERAKACLPWFIVYMKATRL